MAMTKTQKDIIRDKARQIMFEKTQDAKERITKKYLSLIRAFYNEPVFENNPMTEPHYYYRHFNSAFEKDSDIHYKSGLGHTFKSYYRHNVGKQESYTGGILLGDYNMYNDYPHWKVYNQETVHQFVINSFLEGWHGLPTKLYSGIKSSLNPYDEMMEFRESLIKEYNNK